MSLPVACGVAATCFAAGFDTARWWIGMYRIQQLLLAVPILGCFVRCLNTPRVRAHVFFLGVLPVVVLRAGGCGVLGYGVGQAHACATEDETQWSLAKVGVIATAAGLTMGSVYQVLLMGAIESRRKG
jgi:hypothetical protein